MPRRRILVLAPHPDDEAIGCGGTILGHVDAGDEVHVVYLTSGEKGGHGRPEDEVRATREREAALAGRRLRLSSQAFWRLRDGGVRADRATVARLRALLAGLRPARVYAPNPRESHRDHAAAARILGRAVGRRRAPECLGYEVWTPVLRVDEVVDVTRFAAAKRSAIRAYRSQCAVLRFDEAALALSRWRGEMFSWPKGDDGRSGVHAEVFERMRR